MSANSKKFYMHLAISIVLFVLLRFVPASNGLTPIGVNVLSVFIPVLYMWLVIGTDWPSWLAMALVIFTGVMTPAEVYSGRIWYFSDHHGHRHDVVQQGADKYRSHRTGCQAGDHV